MIADGAVATAKLADKSVTVVKVNATGTASSTSFLRGDGAWAAPAGDGQGVTSVGGANGITVINGTTTPTVSLPAGTTSGNVLKWNGTVWASAADAGITGEQDGIIGNEVTNATSGGGLTRSGSGTVASPYTLGISSGGVANTYLANSAVTAEKISDNAVTSAKIADGAITNADINVSAAIALNKIALPDASANNGKVLKSNGTTWVAGDDNNTDANTTYSAGNGLTLAGTTFGIGAGQINSTMIADGAVATAKLADKSITVAKVNATGTASSTSFLRGDGAWAAPAGDGQGVTSVGGANGITVSNGTTTPTVSLPAGTTSGNVLKWNGTAWASAADAGITSEQDGIVGNEVTNATSGGGLTRSGSGTAASPYTLGISSGGVTNTYLANSAVTSEKIGDNAVTSAKVADGAITNANINASAAIALNKIALPAAASNNGKVLKSNGTAWVAGDDNNTSASYTAGDGLTLANATFSIGSGQVSGAMIADGAVATAKLAGNAVTSEKIANGTIKAEDLNSMGAVTNDILTFSGSSWLPKPVNLDGAVVFLGTNDETYSPIPSGTYSSGQVLSIFIKVNAPAGYSYYIFIPYSNANAVFPAFADTINNGIYSRHIILTRSMSYSSFNVKYLIFGIK
jgi:hypothetical protein